MSMRTRVFVFSTFTVTTFILICSLLLGCGGSSISNNPSVYSLHTISPSQVIAGAGDFSMTVVGTNFSNTTKVSFGGTILSPSAVSPTQLTVLVPAFTTEKAGTVNVTVTGTAESNPLQFTINNPVPSLLSISQPESLLNSAPFPLEITGTGFTSSTTVSIGGLSLVPTSTRPTRLTVLVPDTSLLAAAILPVTVTNAAPGGGTSSAQTLTVLNPVPNITTLSLNSVIVDSPDFTLNIIGTGFASGITATLGSLHLIPTAISSTQLSVLVPKTAVATIGVMPISVVNVAPGGGVSNLVDFTVKNPVPTLTSLTPDKTLVSGTSFTLDLAGTLFAPGITVEFGSTLITPTLVSPTQLTAQIPEAAIATSGIVAVTVTNIAPGGGASNALNFIVQNPLPTLASLTLTSIGAGSPDFVLGVVGTGFIATSKMSFGDLSLTPTSITSTELSFTIPASAVIGGGLFSVAITNPGPGGGESNAETFTVINPVPTLGSLSQQTTEIDSLAFPLQITGTGFVPHSMVQFGNSTLTPSAVTPTLLTVQVTQAAITSSGPGALSISVSNPTPGGGTSNTLNFAIQNPQPSLSTINPRSVTAGVGDAVVTISGLHFVQGTTVTMGSTTLTPSSIKPQSLTVTIPSADLVAGTITVSAVNPAPGGGASNVMTLNIFSLAPSSWRTVANNKMVIPNSSQTFNSYNQPSANMNGQVVFKGQGNGKSGPTVGIYVRNVFGNGNGNSGSALSVVTDNNTAVPQPNNTQYNGALANFTQFVSFPRIDLNSDTVAFRGQSQPTWTYTLADGTESRGGTAGIFTNPSGTLTTGAGLLGMLPDFNYFQVPGAPSGTRFDQFPGSPGVTGNNIVFKGNYTEGTTAKTGVYYRDTVINNGQSPVILIASSDTRIPNQPIGEAIVFGSTAPPSAALNQMAFVGLDNEDNPTLGGIYLAPLAPSPTLETIVGIGDQVPGEAANTTFNRFGEGLSFDGHFIAFWGGWGAQTKTVHLPCATDGNKDILAACNQMYPNGYDAIEPANQGVFVYDLSTQELTAVAKTTAEFDDFVYWVFSGRPPGVGGASSDELPEPPRWRSSSFISASAQGSSFLVAFKANTGSVDGIYLAQGPTLMPTETVMDTTMLGTLIDAEAPSASILASVGIERESLRGDMLVVTTSMLNSATTESGAGIYITRVNVQQ